MIKAIVCDFSRVILLPKNPSYTGTLNGLYDKISAEPDFDFYDHYKFNEELLEKIIALKNKYAVSIFTSGHIQKTKEVAERIGPIFDQVISAEDIPFNKKDPQSYAYVAEKLGVLPTEVLYIDDTDTNNIVAQKAGFTTVLFVTNDQLFAELDQILS